MLLAYTAVNRPVQSIPQQDPHPGGQEGSTINIPVAQSTVSTIISPAQSTLQPSQHSSPVNTLALSTLWPSQQFGTISSLAVIIPAQSYFSSMASVLDLCQSDECARMMNVPPY